MASWVTGVGIRTLFSNPDSTWSAYGNALRSYGSTPTFLRFLLDMSRTLLHHGYIRIIAAARSLMPAGVQLVVSLTTGEEVLRAKKATFLS